MNTLLLLFGLALVLFSFEVITPGGILGILGGLFMIGGIVAAFVMYGVTGGTWALVLSVLAAGLMLWLELKVLPKTRLARMMFLRASVHGTSQTLPAEPSLVGEEGEAATAFSPTGVVAIRGRRYEAFSRDGFVAPGTPLRVVAIETFRLIVSKL